MIGSDVEKYKEDIDNDKGLANKRRALVVTSLMLLSLSVSGASIKEASALFFRIEFSNHIGLTYLLGAAVAFLILRYYSYAQNYHEQLFDFWSSRMLSDYRVFHYNSKEYEVQGLLGKRIDIWGGDESGLQEARYKKVGILKRNIVYPSEGYDDVYGPHTYYENIELNSYSESWTKEDFRKLLGFEFKYRMEAVFKHREYLDIMFPYLIGFAAIVGLLVRLYLQ